MNINEAVEKFSSGNSLKKNEIKEVFLSIMNNECNDAEIISFLMTLKTKGETVEEITGAAEVLREMSQKLKLNSQELVDTCGTGGDGQNTFNISTASAIVAAAAGVKIAKHGNKSISSKSGSSDLLEFSGINIDLDEEQAQKCFDDNGITFMFAPKYHKAMKNVANVRKNIKTRTIFNVLGPLSNPANAKYQILGVYDKKLILPIAKVIKDLGVKRAMVVHSEEGLDEISCEKDTYIAEVNENEISEYTINPKEFGLEILSLESLKVDSVDKVSDKVSIADAQIVVSGGRGLKGPENWYLIEELAEVLGAATACSKPVSDMGWRPHSEHVGQTGKPVASNLYIAVGVSGAIQHLAGINSSKIKVVINNDPEAPFFKAADYGIVGDAFEIIPKLIEEIKNLQ